jgi:ketosteroid isomerase-like protein
LAAADTEARLAIADLLAGFCERIDAYDIEGVAGLFSEDCLTDYGPGLGGPIRGRGALRERLLKSQARFRRTHHQLGSQRTDIQGEQARAVTYATAWHERWDGREVVLRLQYHDVLRLEPEGWRIAERRALVSGVSGLEGEFNWVPRAQPAAKLRN